MAGSAPRLADCELFPSNAIFNMRIDDTGRYPTHARSAEWVSWIGSGTRMQADWYVNDNPASPGNYWGIPYNVVDASSTAWPVVQYDFSAAGYGDFVGWPHESDCATAPGGPIQRGCSGGGTPRFPFPNVNSTKFENGLCGGPRDCGDRHVLVVEQGACRLWEAYAAHNLNGQWHAMTTAAWDLRSTALRPANWTAADAAGLPMLPFLAKVHEASSGEIRHALRVTLRDSVIANSYVWPARHAAGSPDGGVPFGSLLRLRADFVIPESWSPQAKAIATALKRYGAYVADIGEDFYIQGEPSAQWSEQTFQDVKAITMQHMEFVDLRNVTSDPRWSADSMAGSW